MSPQHLRKLGRALPVTQSLSLLGKALILREDVGKINADRRRVSAIQAENKQTWLKQTSKPAKLLKEAHSESFADAPHPGLRSHQVNPERAVDVAPLQVAAGRRTPPAGCGAGGRPRASHPPLSRPAASPLRLERRRGVRGGAGDAGARPGWARAAAPPRERRAGPSLFEAQSHRPVWDRSTSPEAAPAASERAPRRRENGRQFFT